MFLTLHPQKDRALLAVSLLLFMAHLLTPAALFAAMPEQAAKHWVFLCGSHANRWLVPDDAPTNADEATQSYDDCDFCSALGKLNAVNTSNWDLRKTTQHWVWAPMRTPAPVATSKQTATSPPQRGPPAQLV